MEQLTPETLTWAHIKAWDSTEMKQQMRGPLRDRIYEVIAEHESQKTAAHPTAEVVPPVEAVSVEVPTEVPVVPVVEAPVVPSTPPAPIKFVQDYQVRDEDGSPIGRPTHLEASSQEELIEKMKEAHIQATRAFHRLKCQKITAIKEPQAAVPAPVSSDAELLAAIKDLKSDDPAVALAAHRKINAVDQAKKDAETAELQRQSKVSLDFLAAHKHDYNNCEANTKELAAYFTEHKLQWTADNLEVAFHDLTDSLKLAPVLQANPVPVVAQVTPPVTPVPQVPVVAPVVPAAVLNPAPPAPRPGVNGGIVPGQNSGLRPQGNAAPQGLTMAEIHSWDGPTMRAKMRIPQLRAEIERVVAAANAKK
jgi:hypothetical protein